MSLTEPTTHDTDEQFDSREDRNDLFTILSNHRRRYVLYACNRAAGDVTLSDVAEQVAAWEYHKPIEAVTSTERKRVYTSIQQHHLSKLEEAGLIDVDRGRLRATDRAKNLDMYLEVVPEHTIPWSLYYVGLSLIGAFAIALSAASLLPDQVTPIVVAGAFTVLVGTSAFVHHVQSRRTRFGETDIPPEVDR
ncbi:MAG: DUF7344 domain-containing protein [Halobacteriota archaeon]